MEEAQETFENWLYKLAERPHVELKESKIDVEYFIETTKR